MRKRGNVDQIIAKVVASCGHLVQSNELPVNELDGELKRDRTVINGAPVDR